jgi:hypothetical protein
MTTNYEKMTSWEIEKASYLILTAKELGMDLQSYGEVAVNEYSGYTYIWLEDYEFSLYMPINCELKRQDVYVLYTDMQTGEEHDESLAQFDVLNDIIEWIEEIKKDN